MEMSENMSNLLESKLVRFDLLQSQGWLVIE